jgi:hypothetical protein
MSPQINFGSASDTRALAIMADNALLGLVSCIRGSPNASLLKQGVVLSRMLSSVPEAQARRAMLDIAREASTIELPAEHRAAGPCEDWSKLREDALAIESALLRLLEHPYADSAKAVFSEIKSKLNNIATTFYQADVSNLRRLKERKSFKVYA